MNCRLCQSDQKDQPDKADNERTDVPPGDRATEEQPPRDDDEARIDVHDQHDQGRGQSLQGGEVGQRLAGVDDRELIVAEAEGDELQRDGRLPEPVEIPEVASRFDMTLYAEETAEGIRLTSLYNRDLFEPARMSGMLEQLSDLLGQIAAAPENPAIGTGWRNSIAAPPATASASRVRPASTAPVS